MRNFINKRIWIIGASSGIGRALAVSLHAKGVSLILSARRNDALNTLNQELENKHYVLPLDISDGQAVAKAVKDVTGQGSLDSTILLAAIYKPAPIIDLDPEFTKKMLDVNIMGAFSLCHALLPNLRKQGYGQLVLCGSVAGYCGLPNGQPYSATKAAVRNLAESLRAEEAVQGLDIKLISPGFVKTPMTAKNDFDMPMAISAEKAAVYLRKGLISKRFEIHFPKRFTLLIKLLSLLPYRLYFWLTKKMVEKA